MLEQQSPVEKFNAKLENAVLEYNKTNRGTVLLALDEFSGMLQQFLADPTGTAKKLGGEPSSLFFKVQTDVVVPIISKSSNGIAYARLEASNTAVEVMGQTFSGRNLAVQLDQSKSRPHQVELANFKINPDVPLAQIDALKDSGFPLIGDTGQWVMGVFAQQAIMAGLYDGTCSYLVVKGAKSKPVRVELDIHPENQTLEMAFFAVGLNPNYPVSIGYGLLKKFLEEKAKRASAKG